MNKFIQYILIILISFFNFYAKANEDSVDATVSPEEVKKESEYQVLIENYKAHLSRVPKIIKKEIKTFRIEIAKIQRQKRDLYRQLSVEAQEYLKQEEQFRQKLPVNEGKIDLNEQNDVSSEQSNKD